MFSLSRMRYLLVLILTLKFTRCNIVGGKPQLKFLSPKYCYCFRNKFQIFSNFILKKMMPVCCVQLCGSYFFDIEFPVLYRLTKLLSNSQIKQESLIKIMCNFLTTTYENFYSTEPQNYKVADEVSDDT